MAAWAVTITRCRRPILGANFDREGVKYTHMRTDFPGSNSTWVAMLRKLGRFAGLFCNCRLELKRTNPISKCFVGTLSVHKEDVSCTNFCSYATELIKPYTRQLCP